MALAGRMDADTLPNHALHHLNYTWNCGIIITDMEGNCKGKDLQGRICVRYKFEPPRGLPQSRMVGYNGRKELNKGVPR